MLKPRAPSFLVAFRPIGFTEWITMPQKPTKKCIFTDKARVSREKFLVAPTCIIVIWAKFQNAKVAFWCNPFFLCATQGVKQFNINPDWHRFCQSGVTRSFPRVFRFMVRRAFSNPDWHACQSAVCPYFVRLTEGNLPKINSRLTKSIPDWQSLSICRNPLFW